MMMMMVMMMMVMTFMLMMITMILIHTASEQVLLDPVGFQKNLQLDGIGPNKNPKNSLNTFRKIKKGYKMGLVIEHQKGTQTWASPLKTFKSTHADLHGVQMNTQMDKKRTKRENLC